MKKFLYLFLVLLVAFCLRIWRLSELFYFHMDEALISFRGWGLFDLGRFFIIGGPSPLGFHHPPYFYWLSALFLPLASYDPIAWGFAGAVIGVITAAALYFLAKKIGGRKLGLVAAIIYSFSFMAIFFDRHYWPLVFNPLLAVLTLWLLMAKTKHKWFFLSLVSVFAVTADPSNLPLLILIVISMHPLKKDFNKKIIFLLSFVFLFFLPLIIFDIRHGGSNVAGVNKLLSKFSQPTIDLQQANKAILLLPRTFSQFWYSRENNISFLHTYCSEYASGLRMTQLPVLQFLAALLLLVYCFKFIGQKSKKEYFLAQLILIYFLGIIFYGLVFSRPVFEHYLAGLLPVFALITAKLVTRFWVAGFFILVAFASFNLTQYTKAVNPYGLAVSQQAVDWTTAKLNGDPFAFDSVSGCFRYNGIRYLYEIKNQPPAISFIDPEFFWLYRNPPSQTFPSKMVVFTDEEVFFKQPVISQKNFGDWQVYILDNKDKNYKIEGL